MQHKYYVVEGKEKISLYNSGCACTLQSITSLSVLVLQTIMSFIEHNIALFCTSFGHRIVCSKFLYPMKHRK